MKNLASACLAILLCSCATFITGTKDEVTIRSVPPGAAFQANSGHVGVTPCTVEVPDDLDLEVCFQLDGYRDGFAVSKPRPSAWLLGNIILGGLIGIAIDVYTGHMNIHEDEVVCMLEPIATEPAQAAAALP